MYTEFKKKKKKWKNVSKILFRGDEKWREFMRLEKPVEKTIFRATGKIK